MIGKLINQHKAKTLIAQGALLIDVRNPISYRDGTIPGAVNIPSNSISQLLTYPKTTSFIFFGENKDDIDLKIVVNYALQLFNKVFILDNKDNWK